MEPGANIAHKLEAKTRTDDVRLKEFAPFSKMLLADGVRKGLQQAGFVYPTVIQATAIPVGKSGIDLLVQSKSGTGKTLIFSTIILEAYRSDIHEPQSLIVAPTREIAVQIESVLNEIGRFCAGFRIVCVIGGLEVADDRKRLQGAKAVVGTPGRLLHLIQNEVLNTSQIRLLVLDEADKMYTQSFRQDLQRIQKALPAKRQTIACSATFCDDLDKELAKIMRNPLLISTEDRATLLVGIKQFVYELEEQKTSILEMQSKLEGLRNIFGRIPFKQCLIFAGSQSRADSYRNYLEKDGWPCELISGAQNQKMRLDMFRKFREFKTRILIATDLMSRGVDSEHVNLVINLELPTDVVTYLHRIGRAGRFGSHGIAISFAASEKDNCTFKRLISQVGSGMNVLKFPQKTQQTTSERDFWDFADAEADGKHFGLFGHELLAPLATQDHASLSDSLENKENQSENVGNSSSSIDTKTFQIDSKDSAMNILDLLVDRAEYNLLPQQKLTPDSRQSSSQQLPSSNTIDDASSIAADSLRSSQQDISRYQSVLMQKVAIPTLVEFLVDRSTDNDKQAGNAKKSKAAIDYFEDYKKAVLNNADETSATLETVAASNEVNLNITKLTNFKELLIDKPPQQNTAVNKKTDIYSDYANFNEGDEDTTSPSQTTITDEIDKATFILSVATPSNAHESIEELHNSSLDLSQVGSSTETQSIPEVKHFTSPINIQVANSIPDVVPPRQGALLVKPQKLTVSVGAQIEIPPRQLLNVNVPLLQPSPAASDNDSIYSVQGSSHSGSSNGQAGDSSGFNERTTTSESSGIETSEAEGEEEQDELTDSESYQTSTGESEDDSFDYDATLEGEEYIDNDDGANHEDDDVANLEDDEDYDGDNDNVNDDDDDVDGGNDNDDDDDDGKDANKETKLNGRKNAEQERVASHNYEQHSSTSFDSHSDPNNAYTLAYQSAYRRWVDMYWNQMTFVNDYVKLFNYVKRQQYDS